MIYDKELNRVTRKLHKLHTKQKLKDKNIYVFGVSDISRQIINIIRDLDYVPTAVLDNDKLKHNSYCARIPVISPNDVNVSDNNIYIIYSRFWREMAEQFLSKGVKKEDIIVLIKERQKLIVSLFDAIKGKNIYKKIIKQYNTENVFLCPYTGTGDIYLIGTFWNEFCQKNNIHDYAFVVVSGACKKVAELFHIKNIHVLPQKTLSDYLIKAHMLWPNDVKIKLLNDCWGQIHTNPIEWLRGFKNLEFTPMFKKFVFDLPEESKPHHPVLIDHSSEIESLMKDKGLEKHKTVVLSPYSNTLADLPDEFWTILAEQLVKKGFTVCTNSSGDSEPAIENTVPIFFPLTMAAQFVEKAGFFVGVRSGFCDVISNANAKKAILYDKHNRFYMGSAFEYFNFRDMQLCDDALEIEYKPADLELIINNILSMIGE